MGTPKFTCSVRPSKLLHFVSVQTLKLIEYKRSIYRKQWRSRMRASILTKTTFDGNCIHRATRVLLPSSIPTTTACTNFYALKKNLISQNRKLHCNCIYNGLLQPSHPPCKHFNNHRQVVIL